MKNPVNPAAANRIRRDITLVNEKLTANTEPLLQPNRQTLKTEAYHVADILSDDTVATQ
jgi:hypothetical protein